MKLCFSAATRLSVLLSSGDSLVLCSMADRRVKEILLNCLYAICSDVPWEYGEAWVADHSGTFQLAVHKVNRNCQVSSAEFIRRSLSLKLSPNTSLPGNVMSARKRLFWNQDKLISDIDRGQLIIASKFQCCLGLPVFTVKSSSFVGVLLLFSTTAVSPLSDDNIEFAAAVADTAATQVDDLNIVKQSIHTSSVAKLPGDTTSWVGNSLDATGMHQLDSIASVGEVSPHSHSKIVETLEDPGIIPTADAYEIVHQKSSPSMPMSKNFLRATQLVKDKSIDWNSTLLSIQAVLAKHTSSSQESERQRVSDLCSIFFDVGSTNNLAACECVRLMMETLEGFIFVSNPGISPAVLPQRGRNTNLLAHSCKDMMSHISELTEMKNKAVTHLEASLQQKLHLEEKIQELESQLRKKVESGKAVKKELLKATLEFHFDRLGVPNELQPKYSESSKRMQTTLDHIEDESTLLVGSDQYSSGQANDEYSMLATRMSGPLSNRVSYLKHASTNNRQSIPDDKFQSKAFSHKKELEEECRRCNSELADMKMLLIEVTGCLHGKLDILEGKLQLHMGHKIGEQEAIFHFQSDAEMLCREISEQHVHWIKVSSELQELMNESRALNGHEPNEIQIELDIFEKLSIAQKQSTAAHWVSLKKHISSVLLTSVHRKMHMPSLIQLLFSAFDFIHESMKTAFANSQTSIFLQLFDAPFFEFMNYRYAVPEVAVSVCRDMFSILESLKSIKSLPNIFLNSFAIDQFNFQWQYVLLFRKYYSSHRSLSQSFLSTAEALKFLTVSMYAELNSSLLDPVLAKFLIWKKKNVVREASLTANDFVEFICCLLATGLEPRVERCRAYCQENARAILIDELLYTQFESICNELIIGSSRGSIGEHAQEHYSSIRSMQASGVDVSIDMLAHKLAIVQIAVLVDDAGSASCKMQVSGY